MSGSVSEYLADRLPDYMRPGAGRVHRRHSADLQRKVDRDRLRQLTRDDDDREVPQTDEVRSP